MKGTLKIEDSNSDITSYRLSNNEYKYMALINRQINEGEDDNN